MRSLIRLERQTVNTWMVKRWWLRADCASHPHQIASHVTVLRFLFAHTENTSTSSKTFDTMFTQTDNRLRFRVLV